MFNGITNNFTYCIYNQSAILNIKNQLTSLSNAKRDCSSKCYSTPHRLNITTNECEITSCGQNDSKIYEYNNECFEICPKRTKVSQEDEYICQFFNCDFFYNYNETDCISEIQDGYYIKHVRHAMVKRILIIQIVKLVP